MNVDVLIKEDGLVERLSRAEVLRPLLHQQRVNALVGRG